MMDHLNAFQRLLNKLSEMGIKIDDEIHVMWFIGTLPHSWKVFNISLCNFVDEGIIWTVSVKNSVHSEEARRQSNSSTWHLDVFVIGSRESVHIESPKMKKHEHEKL